MPLPAEHHESHNDTNVLLRRNRELATLRSIAETLNTSVSLQETFGKILPLLVELLGLDTGWIFMRIHKLELVFMPAHRTRRPSARYRSGCGM
jgi:nitrate/nitrite-specific signal transduction histidine kinase